MTDAVSSPSETTSGLNPANLELATKHRIKDKERFFATYAMNTLNYLRQHRDVDRNSFQHFLAMASRYAHHSKAQLFQDLWAWWESGQAKGGFFVEFGAATGVRLSNTHFLEKRCEWKGILAEPHPKFWPSIGENRQCIVSDRCVYSVSGKRIKFMATQSGELGRISAINPSDRHEQSGGRDQHVEVEVETISLNDLLESAGAPSEIDYMSVDTEGSEFEILSHFDFKRWKVRTMTVEHNHTAMREQLYALLTGNGYRRKWEQFSRFDDWYVLD